MSAMNQATQAVHNWLLEGLVSQFNVRSPKALEESYQEYISRSLGSTEAPLIMELLLGADIDWERLHGLHGNPVRSLQWDESSLSLIKGDGNLTNHLHGYPIFYRCYTATLCAKCASDALYSDYEYEANYAMSYHAHWEGDLYCDQCEECIEPAYPSDNADDDDSEEGSVMVDNGYPDPGEIKAIRNSTDEIDVKAIIDPYGILEE